MNNSYVRSCVCGSSIFSLLLLLALAPGAQGQFTYITNNGALTITGYTGPGGAVIIPSTINGLPVTSIGNGAFNGYGNPLSTILNSVAIPNSVTNIGDASFRDCYRLSNVTIGGSVTSIGGAAFYECSALTSVTIPSRVTNIGDRAFGWCTSLSAITVDAFNSAYSSESGILYNKSQTTLIQCPGAKAGSYSIPNTVINIGDWAFEDCTSLTSVALGNGVLSIGHNSFAYCTHLTSVTIPNGVISIANQGFGWTALTNVTIPSSVTNIEQGAFWDCSRLMAITVDALNPAYSSVDGVWFDKTQTTLIQCPAGRTGSYTVPHSVMNIGGWAFSFCASLTSITIPSNVASIGYDAFYGCSALGSMTIPSSVTSIAQGAFWSCTSLSAITVDVLNPAYSSEAGVLFNKNQTTLIQCPGGKSGRYTIPNRVTNIVDWAFQWCGRLTSVTIPDNVTSIGMGAFEGCRSLTNVTMSSGATRIEISMFAYCTSLTNITIPSSVTYIGSWAFASCTNLSGVYFRGNAPTFDTQTAFSDAGGGADNNVTVYYLQGASGWGSTFEGRPTALWPLPAIQTPPQTQTAEVGAAVTFEVGATIPGEVMLAYQWFFNSITRLGCTNSILQLAAVQYSQAGTYTVVVTNAAGSVTSSPAFLNVITPVERRQVPALSLMGQPGTTLNLDFTVALGPAPAWTTFDHVPLTAAPQWYFDLRSPLPPQGFYRAWQSGGAAPSTLDLHFVPALTLTGAIGSSVRVDYINQFGPTDAWVTLATVTLTNTTQLYFDTSAIGRPTRLWRLVPVP